MSTTTNSLGNVCTSCVAMAIGAVSIATLATVIWVLLL